MKQLCILLITFALLSCSGQPELESLKINLDFEGNELEDLNIPQIKLYDKSVETKINKNIIRKVTEIDSWETDSDLNNKLSQWAATSKAIVSHEVSLMNDHLFSIQIVTEFSSGAYPSTSILQLNYDLQTGSNLKLTDVLEMDHAFEEKLKNDFKTFKNEEQEQLNKLKNSGALTLDQFDWILFEYRKCHLNMENLNYLLYDNEIELIYKCDFPHAIRSQELYFKKRYGLNEKQLKFKI